MVKRISLIGTGISLVLIGFFIGKSIYQSKPLHSNKVEYIYIEKNKEEITEDPTIKITKNKEFISITQTNQTPYYGNIVTQTTIPRYELDYTHRIGLGVGFIDLNPLVKFSYIYKKHQFSAMVGYNIKDRTPIYGLSYQFIFNIK